MSNPLLQVHLNYLRRDGSAEMPDPTCTTESRVGKEYKSPRFPDRLLHYPRKGHLRNLLGRADFQRWQLLGWQPDGSNQGNQGDSLRGQAFSGCAVPPGRQRLMQQELRDVRVLRVDA